MTSVTAFMHGGDSFAPLCLESPLWLRGHLDVAGALG